MIITIVMHDVIVSLVLYHMVKVISLYYPLQADRELLLSLRTLDSLLDPNGGYGMQLFQGIPLLSQG